MFRIHLRLHTTPLSCIPTLALASWLAVWNRAHNTWCRGGTALFLGCRIGLAPALLLVGFLSLLIVVVVVEVNEPYNNNNNNNIYQQEM